MTSSAPPSLLGVFADRADESLLVGAFLARNADGGMRTGRLSQAAHDGITAGIRGVLVSACLLGAAAFATIAGLREPREIRGRVGTVTAAGSAPFAREDARYAFRLSVHGNLAGVRRSGGSAHVVAGMVGAGYRSRRGRGDRRRSPGGGPGYHSGAVPLDETGDLVPLDGHGGA
ncbi:hypothetical protein ACFWPV_05125 [Streptomyces uncialis]|uniref:hypothetical protein n=1 Tax=Streptomyces uncialis TaxID=1048205 RepID=UPI00365A289F